VAVGMVFGMALAQRILNRYPSSDEKTNLLVRFASNYLLIVV
jgi:hypothetical protein